ncbi:MAG: hypothetical protein ACR2PT_19645, partial [Endozoicomonas sp.]
MKKLLSSAATLALCVSVAFPTLSHAASTQPASLIEYSGREKVEYDYAYSLGIQATVYGWAPVMMDVALDLQTSVDVPMNNGQAPLNQLGSITRL